MVFTIFSFGRYNYFFHKNVIYVNMYWVYFFNELISRFT